MEIVPMQFLVDLGNQAYGVVLFWLDCFICNQTFKLSSHKPGMY